MLSETLQPCSLMQTAAVNVFMNYKQIVKDMVQ